MNVTDMYPATYISGGHLEDPAYARTITACAMEDLVNRAGDTDNKPVISLNESVGSAGAFKLILNKTNARAIANELGSDETNDWVGKEITIVRAEWQGQPVVRILAS